MIYKFPEFIEPIVNPIISKIYVYFNIEELTMTVIVNLTVDDNIYAVTFNCLESFIDAETTVEWVNYKLEEYVIN